MRGHYEESPEQKAIGELRQAARRYASAYLVDMFGPRCTDAEKLLESAALAYVSTVVQSTTRPKRKPRK